MTKWVVTRGAIANSNGDPYEIVHTAFLSSLQEAREFIKKKCLDTPPLRKASWLVYKTEVEGEYTLNIELMKKEIKDAEHFVHSSYCILNGGYNACRCKEKSNC